MAAIKSEIHLDKDTGQRSYNNRMVGTTDSSGNDAGRMVAEITSMPAGPYVVEQGRFEMIRVTTAGSDQPLGSTGGAVGDYLHAIIIPRGLINTNTKFAYVRDNGVTFLQLDAITQGLDIMPGTVIPIGAVSQSGEWAINFQTAGIDEIIAIGRFT